jgi:hypothetical protein
MGNCFYERCTHRFIFKQKSDKKALALLNRRFDERKVERKESA